MSYIVRHCDICKKEYHVHENGKIRGACEHIRLNDMKGRKAFKGIIADAHEMDKMLAEW